MSTLNGGERMLQPSDQKDKFDPNLYLEQYYGDNNMSKGLKIILFFLPNIAARLKIKPKCESIENRGSSLELGTDFKGDDVTTLLDVGSGPAIYMALGLRRKVDLIVLSDFAKQNRNHLVAWKKGINKTGFFDWTAITRAIAELESLGSQWQAVHDEARRKVCNVAYCDVHDPRVLLKFELNDNQLLPPYQSNEASKISSDQKLKFDVVSSIFCLEYASTTYDQYKNALKNICALIKPGGYLILGGAYEESFYSIGTNKFACHFLTENQVFNALKEAGIDTDDRFNFAYYSHDNAFVAVGLKK